MAIAQTMLDINDEIKSLFYKLHDIEHQVMQQEKNVEMQRAKLEKMTNTSDQLVATMKATRTSVELLREELEELHIVAIELFKASKH